jgi:branched-chain amino acid aminotransferase
MFWLDGVVHETSLVPFDLADRGLLLGDGVFDTALMLDGTILWREAHLARLVAACRTLGFAIDLVRLEATAAAVAARGGHGSVRITVTRGAGPRGLAPPSEAKPTVFASLAPLRAAALFCPLRLHVTTIRRNESAPTSRLKSLGYLDGVFASREAIAAGCDDALFLNTRERVACTSVGNVMALIGEQLLTPPLGDGVLDGIVRGIVLASCDEIGLEPVERSLTLADLERADAVCVTNSLRLVAPVTSIGRTSLGSSGVRRCQALIAHVAQRVRAETGLDPRTLADA